MACWLSGVALIGWPDNQHAIYAILFPEQRAKSGRALLKLVRPPSMRDRDLLAEPKEYQPDLGVEDLTEWVCSVARVHFLFIVLLIGKVGD